MQVLNRRGGHQAVKIAYNPKTAGAVF